MSRRKQDAPRRLLVTDRKSAEFRGCINKRVHERESQARKVARKTGSNNVAYKCIFCPYWHVGRDKR